MEKTLNNYVVFYYDKLGKEVSKTIKAVSGWAAKWVLISEHHIPMERIIRVV